VKPWLIGAAGAALATAVLAADEAEPPPLPEPLTDAAYRPVDPAAAGLGQLLFYDRLLSGNRDIACATCHHPRHGTSDGLSLGLGAGGLGLGPGRRPDPAAARPPRRQARNAPALWNLGATELTALFHDGRLEVDESRDSGLRGPVADELLQGLPGMLAAQAIFPLLSHDEMAGPPGSNPVADALAEGRITGPDGAIARILARLEALPAYREGFASAFDDIAAGAPIGLVHVTSALAAFIAFEFRSDTSLYDLHLWGAERLEEDARAGKMLFFGSAGCADCHAGPLFTDHGFHAMGQPQIGPGPDAASLGHGRDTGRARISGRAADAYAFRTPPLRNVTVTGPWGHAGAFTDLAAFLRHHADPVAGLAAYRRQARLPPPEDPADWAVMDDPAARAAIAAAVTRPPVALSAADIAALVAFLDSLTDEDALAGRLGIPEAVPSGLPVDR
jgi:cytochrome c peroxidase